MERYYYFIANDGDAVFDDKTGTLLADDQAARQNAVQIHPTSSYQLATIVPHQP